MKNKVAMVTGGDSGIGRAVAIAFAKEGADLAIAYLDEHEDAAETKQIISNLGRHCLPVAVDLRKEESCHHVVEATLKAFGRLDILVNNHGVQYHQQSIMDITREQLMNTFQTNIISFFDMTKAALPHLTTGSSIINTTSDTAFSGSRFMIDCYSCERSRCLLYPFFIPFACQPGDSGKRGSAWADLDTPDPVRIYSRRGNNIWYRGTNEATRATV